MKKSASLLVAGGLFGALALAQSGPQPGAYPAPGQGWTTEDARRIPHRPHELGYFAATVTKISVHKKTGRFVVTLDNGQRWTQIENKPDVKVAVGDEIKMQKSTIGSYMLMTQDGVETRVRRDR